MNDLRENLTTEALSVVDNLSTIDETSHDYTVGVKNLETLTKCIVVLDKEEKDNERLKLEKEKLELEKTRLETEKKRTAIAEQQVSLEKEKIKNDQKRLIVDTTKDTLVEGAKIAVPAIISIAALGTVKELETNGYCVSSGFGRAVISSIGKIKF